ncbi:MAG: DMT family transporter [Actinomycetota bacterium]|nr:DMT family transporter [Actinomycetota bacterium]
MNPWTPLVFATVGWGTSAVLTRAVILRGVDSTTIVPLRMAIAFATLGAVVLATGRFRTRNKQAWKRGLVLGTVGMAIPMFLMTLSLEDLPISLGGLLIALIPIATIAAAHFIVDGERFQAKSLPGLLIALAGSALLVGIGGASVEGVGNLWRGVLLVTAGVVFAGIGGAYSRKFALEVPSDDLVLPQFTVNTVVLFVVIPLVADIDIASVDAVSWIMIVGVGAIGTTVAFASFLIAAGLNPASRLALTGYTVPVVAVALAVIFLGETLTPPIIGGAILIVAGVILAERYTDHVPEPGVFDSR